MQIRELDLNNIDKKVAYLSIKRHLEDLYEYISSFDLLEQHKKLIDLDMAIKRAEITNMILRNVEIVLK